MHDKEKEAGRVYRFRPSEDGDGLANFLHAEHVSSVTYKTCTREEPLLRVAARQEFDRRDGRMRW